MIKGQFSTGQVWVDNVELLPDKSQKIWNHSPNGFSWSYGGSGPAQLALAILLSFGVEEKEAVRLHQPFKRDIIAWLPQEDFELSSQKVKAWIDEHKVKSS